MIYRGWREESLPSLSNSNPVLIFHENFQLPFEAPRLLKFLEKFGRNVRQCVHLPPPSLSLVEDWSTFRLQYYVTSVFFKHEKLLFLLLLLHLLLLLPRDFAINLPYVASFTNWRRYFQVSIDRCTIILSTPDNCNGSEASEMSLHVYT